MMMGKEDGALLAAELADVQQQPPSPPSSSPHSFPFEHLIPKADTQVLDFLQKYPHYDGRNVTVGILDTGIDPGSPTLRNFPYGNNGNGDGGDDGNDAKLLNVVDCTGAGDVDMSFEVQAKWTKCSTANTDDDNKSSANNESSQSSSYCWTVQGLSGQTLCLNPNWNLQPFPKEHDDPDPDAEIAAAASTSKTKKNGDDEESNKSKKDDEENNIDETKKDNKTAPVRLAVKRGYELFPRPLRSRIQEHRKKLFQAEISNYVCTVRSKLAKLDDIDSSNKSSSTGSGGDGDDDKSATATTAAALEKTKTRQDLQALLEVLNDKEWEQEQTDPGPLYDVVVFYDGQQFRALLMEVCYDSDNQQPQHEHAAAAAAKMMHLVPMAAFAVERQYATFGVQDQYHYAVNFYDNGRILSIVRDSSPHGSHVASICSSTEEQQQQQEEQSSSSQGGDGSGRHGVAPGSKLVSLAIGDVRLGSMETGSSLTRALIEAQRQKCDVINMSYADVCACPNQGRFVELAEELVWKHNIIYVGAAGNSGPALSSVATPGGTTTAMLGVAAHVSPEMAKILYGLPLADSADGEVVYENGDGTVESFPGTTYTWSSVGPAADGHQGISFMAPGGAFAAVPTWCLQKVQMMNGTSMASPHATGCIALLISACKAEGIPVSPARIRRALENTAKPSRGISFLEQGSGMIQVDKAWEYLKKFKDDAMEDVFFNVAVESLSGRPRGIYMREANQCSVRHTFSISIDPQWRRQDVATEEQQQQQINFEAKFVIETTAPDWVTVPARFFLMNNGRSFKIDVDPTGLQPGLHTALVIGVDASQSERRVLFTVPITIAKPMDETLHLELGTLEFKSGEIKRFFAMPPPGCTWMDITITDKRHVESEGNSRLFSLHTIQLLPHASWRDFEYTQTYGLRPSRTVVASIALESGIPVEICLARYWSTLGMSAIHVDVKFRGIRPVPNHLLMPACGAGHGAIVRVTSDLADESISPAAKLSKWKTPLRPLADAVIKPLGERDILAGPEKKIYQLLLTYEFNQEEKGSFVPRASAMQDCLYESGFEGQMIRVFDGDKKLLGTIDAFPAAIAAPKGKVVVRMQIRHDNPEKLEKLKDMIMWIERSIDGISLKAYSSREEMILSKGTFRTQILRRGTSVAVWFAEPSFTELPSTCKAGDVLEGSFTLGSGETSLPGSGKRPGGFPITYVVGPKPEKPPSDPEIPEPKDDRSAEEKLEEAIRDLKVAHLGKLTDKEKEDGKFEELYSKMLVDYPDHLPLLMAMVKHLDSHKKRQDKLQEIVSSAEEVVKRISEDELALHFGRKIDTEDPKASKENKVMTEKKTFLTDALARMTMACADMASDDNVKTKFNETLKRLKAWVDIDATEKYSKLVMEREERAGRYGSTLKVINKLLSKEIKEKDFIGSISKSSLLEKRAEIFEKLGYSVLVEYDKKNRIIACPKSYALF